MGGVRIINNRSDTLHDTCMEDNKAKKRFKGSYGDGIILYKVVKEGSAEKVTHK